MRNPRETRLVFVSCVAACAVFTACGPAENQSAGTQSRATGATSGSAQASKDAGASARAPSGSRASSSVAARGQGYRDSSGEDDVIVVKKGVRPDGAGSDLGLVASCGEGQYAGKHEAQAMCGAIVGENESAQYVPSAQGVE